jgi:hypothetical protein
MLKGSVCPLGPCQGYGVKFFDVDGDFLKESSTVTANLGPSRNTLLFSFWHLLMFRTRGRRFTLRSVTVSAGLLTRVPLPHGGLAPPLRNPPMFEVYLGAVPPSPLKSCRAGRRTVASP